MDLSQKIAEHYLIKQSCPYFQDGRTAQSEHIRFRKSADPVLSALLIQQGWRRFGADLYRMRCETCRLCIPIRIDASEIRLSTSLRRILRINRDIVIIPQKPRISKEYLQLWREYSIWKHHASKKDLDEEVYRDFASPWGLVFEYRKESVAGDLLALSHIDPLPDGFSSVYFSFLPSAASRSLGYFSILAEAYIAFEYSTIDTLDFSPIHGTDIKESYSQDRTRQGIRPIFYYLGFWVPGAAKMNYKSRIQPFSLLLTDERSELPQQWFTFDNRLAAEQFLKKVLWPGF